MQELVLEAIEYCRNLPDSITLVIISIMPCFGIRGGMVASYFLQTPILKAIPLCIAGNFIPVPFIFAFGRFLKNFFKKNAFLKQKIERLEQKAAQKSGLIEKYGFWGIILFIALPLPGTGAYMGTLIASLSSVMSIKKSFAAIICGMLSSAIIMGGLLSLF